MKKIATKLIFAAAFPIPALALTGTDREAHRSFLGFSFSDFLFSTAGTFVLSMLASALVFRFAFNRK